MKRTIKHHIIHCAATPNGKPISIADIDKMHQQRGFKRDTQMARNFNPLYKSIGYHFFIEVDGAIRTGRHLEEIGAHVQGNNAHSIGTCMAGTDKFTTAQWESLRTLCVGLIGEISNRTIMHVDTALDTYAELGIKLLGHRDYSPDLNGDGQITRNEWIKTCPGFSVAEWGQGGMLPLPKQTL